ncbi:hypothetical protein F5Y08DRAFT_325374 [Xylaria arbuscula]|nr:hypothetical protein F5Y08DRAFT_325374 [Xylaria arbuscula]
MEVPGSTCPMIDRVAEMWIRKVDDWSGVTDKQERKRLQNRRNQRTYSTKSRDAHVHTRASTSTAPVDRQSGPKLTVVKHDDAEAVEAVVRAVNSINLITGDSELNWRIMQRFEEFALRSYVSRSLRLNILPSLSQFHFIKALWSNIDVLGLSSTDMHDDALSPFNTVLGPAHVSSSQRDRRLAELPVGLRPTALQRETLHHPWLDLLPIPAMRDNIFRLGLDLVDEDELCHAMRGVIPGQSPGVLVWGDPWVLESWEVTEEFVRSSWGWVVANCRDLMRSTNRWRMQRAEKPLFHL